MGLPAAMALPDTVRDATAVLGNGIEAHTARAIVASAREALAEEGARTAGSGSGSDGLTAATREAVDAAVAGAVEAHVAWWRARTRKRRLVVERAEADGLARANGRVPCASSSIDDGWGRRRPLRTRAPAGGG